MRTCMGQKCSNDEETRHHCGAQPAQQRNALSPKRPFTYNGIERKDNAQGYSPENVVPCFGQCNRVKGTLPYQEYLHWLFQSVDHLVGTLPGCYPQALAGSDGGQPYSGGEAPGEGRDIILP